MDRIEIFKDIAIIVIALILIMIIAATAFVMLDTVIRSTETQSNMATIEAIEYGMKQQANIQLEQRKIIVEQQKKIEKLEKQLKKITQELEKWEIMELEVTAYAPMDNASGVCANNNPNTTSTGTSPTHGTVAVNPEIIPYGTRMYIPDYGWGIAADTGSALRQRDNVIDIYKATHHDAVKWGRRALPILIERND